MSSIPTTSMEEDIDFLLLTPFNEIIAKAEDAIEKARGAENAEMIKAAQGLLKEGERARKAIEPVARRQLTLYGENFTSALTDHDGISGYIDTLNELVYVFDDFTEPDSFDTEKFKELSKSVQQTTMRILPLLRRMKLETPPGHNAASTPSTPHFPTSTPFSTGVSRVSSVGGRSSASSFSGTAAGSPHLGGEPALARVPSAQRLDNAPPTGLWPLSPREEPPVMGSQSGPDLGWNNGRQQEYNGVPSPVCAPKHLAAPPMLPSITEPPPPPPPVPATNPWQVGLRPLVGTIVEGDEEENRQNTGWDINGIEGAIDQANDLEALERRRRISTRPDSPTLPSPTTTTSNAPDFPLPSIPPPPPPTSSFSSNSFQQQYVRRVDDGVDAWQRRLDSEDRRMREAANPPPRTMPSQPGQLSASVPASAPPVSATWSLFPPQAQPQQQQTQKQAPSHTQNNQALQQQSLSAAATPSAPLQQISPRQSQSSTITTSTASSTTNGSAFSFDSYINGLSNQMRESALDPVSPLAGPTHTNVPASPDGSAPAQLNSFPSKGGQSSSAPAPTPVSPVPEVLARQLQQRDDGGLEVIPPVIDIDSGLIPVESPPQSGESISSNDAFVPRPRDADCNIGPGSAFHLLKGFCEGAKEVQRGNAGVRQIKKLSYSGAGTYAAKCTNCLYELQWTEVEKDRQNEASASYRMHGIGFRLRFLSKSHLPAKQVDDPLYACLFCLQEGRTLEESDATVFFSQSQLFSHLSRHPRPLPHVPGVTVIDGPERPEQFRNNYDLHFTVPPATSELDGIRRELQKLPTATAIETFRKAHGTLRRPFDSAMPIQFPAGSKIVGIEFPEKYKGEWGIGWFDNVRGPFPVESVRLDTPPKNEIRTQGTSNMRATVRWKWASNSTYRNTDWLRLDKNEAVSNIIWSHPEHWCWAGTNSRGKWGYFPQSHIEPKSLTEVPQSSDAVSVVSQDRPSPGSGGGGGGGFLSRLRSHNNHTTPASVRRPMSIASQSTSSSR